jgi:hypothetical protein
MLYRLRRHPIPMTATFRHGLVVAYAFPADVLQALLPPGLIVDRHGDLGFAAAALVDLEAMRPVGLPPVLGRPYVLVGYRIFCRYRTPSGRLLRGLHILRSEASNRSMVVAGNLLTHYGYHLADCAIQVENGRLDAQVRSRDGHADLSISADLEAPGELPAGSPFATLAEARRFAGPLPFTFDFEPETGSIIVIEGVRKEWDPRPVSVDVRTATFFDSPRFAGAAPVLANAFHVAGVEYAWLRGVVQPLPPMSAEADPAAVKEAA